MRYLTGNIMRTHRNLITPLLFYSHNTIYDIYVVVLKRRIKDGAAIVATKPDRKIAHFYVRANRGYISYIP